MGGCPVTWWEIVLTAWIVGSFPLAVLFGKALAHPEPVRPIRTRASSATPVGQIKPTRRSVGSRAG